MQRLLLLTLINSVLTDKPLHVLHVRQRATLLLLALRLIEELVLELIRPLTLGFLFQLIVNSLELLRLLVHRCELLSWGLETAEGTV